MSKNKSMIITTTPAVLTVLLSAITIPYGVFGIEEDDGWVEGDYEGSPKEQEERAEEDWEDAGRPGEDNDNNDDENVDDDNSENENNANDDNRYCDQDDSGSCWDRKDYDEETGLYPCIDGSQVTDWRKCTDDNDNYNRPKVVHKTTVIQSPSASVTINTNPAEAYSCRLEGSADGIHQKFDAANYQECTIYVNGQDAYTDGFVTGCTQVGNSEQLCQAFVHSSILNTKSQPTKIAIQPAQLPVRTTTK